MPLTHTESWNRYSRRRRRRRWSKKNSRSTKASNNNNNNNRVAKNNKYNSYNVNNRKRIQTKTCWCKRLIQTNKSLWTNNHQKFLHHHLLLLLYPLLNRYNHNNYHYNYPPLTFHYPLIHKSNLSILTVKVILNKQLFNNSKILQVILLYLLDNHKKILKAL